MPQNDRFAPIPTHDQQGQEVMHTISSIVFLTYTHGDKLAIVERTGGIDVDNAARPYHNDTLSTYADLLWNVMNYLSFKPNGIDTLRARIIGDENFTTHDAKWESIEIIFPSDDIESYDTVWQIMHPDFVDLDLS